MGSRSRAGGRQIREIMAYEPLSDSLAPYPAELIYCQLIKWYKLLLFSRFAREEVRLYLVMGYDKLYMAYL